MKKKVVTIFTGLVKLNKNLVGTAVVYQQLAYWLNKNNFSVNLVIPEKNDDQLAGVDYFIYQEKNNKKLIQQSDIIFFGAYPPIEPLKYAYQQKKNIITYLWSIAPIGSLEFKDFTDIHQQEKLHDFIVASYNLSLKYSNKIFCRSQRVKDLVLGSLITLGKANLSNYLKDRNFNNLIEVVSFGIGSTVRHSQKDNYRKLFKNIQAKDFVLIWNGGIWNWHDGVKLVKIMNYIKQRDKKIKLIFQGFHNPDKIYSIEAKKTKQLADKLKLTDKNIFFPTNWVNFENRDNYLTESDAGIVISPNIPEANYFIKTRFYDYLWADIPIILNNYEAFAGEVATHNLGLILSGDYKKDAATIIKFVNDKKLQLKIKHNIKKYKKDLSWEKQLKAVIEYCKK